MYEAPLFIEKSIITFVLSVMGMGLTKCQLVPCLENKTSPHMLQIIYQHQINDHCKLPGLYEANFFFGNRENFILLHAQYMLGCPEFNLAYTAPKLVSALFANCFST